VYADFQAAGFDMKKGSRIWCNGKPKGVDLGVVAQRWHRRWQRGKVEKNVGGKEFDRRESSQDPVNRCRV
jgi:hypothetical protein